VLAYKLTTDRRELNSPESKLERLARKASKEAPEGMASAEGWNLWVAVFGVGRNKTVLSQELVSPQ
jgi:hypothetical protein